MKRWAIVTVTLYALLLLVLTAPALVMGWMRWATAPDGTGSIAFGIGWDQAFAVIQEWSYWLGLLIFAAAQALLLIVPVRMAERRPIGRRSILVPVVTGSFLLGNMFVGGVLAIVAAIFGDQIDPLVDTPVQATRHLMNTIPGINWALTNLGITPSDQMIAIMHCLGIIALFWLVWGLIFHHFAKADEPDTLMQRTTRWLIRGSILELLVAVPCHIVTRQREDCCAPAMSFWGLVTGISVMLMSFGPGVFFLFVKRIHQKRGIQNRHPGLSSNG